MLISASHENGRANLVIFILNVRNSKPNINVKFVPLWKEYFNNFIIFPQLSLLFSNF